ncbi:MAG: FimV/HubP family polar landmark protein [Steroidobacteraceae bacterium]
MFERKLVQFLLLGLIAPGSAFALGLGEIHLKSALNSPLDAEIDVTGATAEELSGLNAALASRDSFARYGLDFPGFLGNVRMQVGRSADGRNVIRVQSSEAVTEPFATLLVDVNWARGHLVREYTVLVDPPVFTPASNAAPAAVAAPVAGATARSSTVERPAASAAAASPAPAPVQHVAESSGGPNPGSAYRVHRGDTLSGIATGAYGAGTRQKGLVAIYRANPAAFDRNNMNELRSGATLQLPAQSEVDAIGPAEASAEVHRQYADWSASHGEGGRLRLVPPQDNASGAVGGTGTKGAATTAATSALQERVNQLEAQVTEQKRLLELRNGELAELQRKLGQPPAKPTPPVEAPKPAAAPPAAATPPAATPPGAAAEPSATPPTEAKPPVKKPRPVTKPAAQPQPQAEGGSLLDWLIEHWYLPVLLILAAAGGIFGLRKWRERQSMEFDRSLDRLSGAAFEPPAPRPRQPETQTLRALPNEEATSFVVEETSSTREQPRLNPAALRAAAPAAVEVDDTISGDTALGISPGAVGEGDPLAEADFHMAYGLYDQAADLVRLAIQREPQRRDLKLKLLEVFFVWGNKEQFLATARELAGSRDQALPGEWEKTVIMGRQIAPDDELFAGTGALGGAASAGVDLNLEGGQNRVDFDLMGEPSVTLRSEDAVDLDLGAALGDKDNTGESRTVGGDGVDFVLDDPLRGAESTGITREMPEQDNAQGVTAEVTTLQNISGDAPTVEQPTLIVGDNPTIRQKLEPHIADLPIGDRTAEVALDDLGLDLGALEGGEGEVSFDATGESPTLLASLDETARERLSGKPDTGKAGSAPGISESGTWLFTDNDLASMLPPDEVAKGTETDLITAVSPPPAEFDTSMTGQIAALKVDGLKDIDLDFDKPVDATGTHQIPPGALLDLDLGAAPAPSTASETQKLTIETALPDLEPATMSEVGTKLDLARAYMDMGDPEGARSILDEVLSEGSVSQKQEARRLIESLPG